jgi:hypothetical protein
VRRGVGMKLLQTHRRHAKMPEGEPTGSAGRSEERDGKIDLHPCEINRSEPNTAEHQSPAPTVMRPSNELRERN